MADKTETPKEKILLVYIGRRITTDEKLTPYWLRVTPGQLETGTSTDGTTGSYGKATSKYLTGSIGAVYEVPAKDDGTTIYPAEANYRGKWPVESDRVEWQGIDSHDAAKHAMRKKAKKEGETNEFLSVLDPIAEKYQKTLGNADRAALLGVVINYITRFKVR